MKTQTQTPPRDFVRAVAGGSPDANPVQRLDVPGRLFGTVTRLPDGTLALSAPFNEENLSQADTEYYSVAMEQAPSPPNLGQLAADAEHVAADVFGVPADAIAAVATCEVDPDIDEQIVAVSVQVKVSRPAFKAKLREFYSRIADAYPATAPRIITSLSRAA